MEGKMGHHGTKEEPIKANCKKCEHNQPKNIAGYQVRYCYAKRMILKTQYIERLNKCIYYE